MGQLCCGSANANENEGERERGSNNAMSQSERPPVGDAAETEPAQAPVTAIAAVATDTVVTQQHTLPSLPVLQQVYVNTAEPEDTKNYRSDAAAAAMSAATHGTGQVLQWQQWEQWEDQYGLRAHQRKEVIMANVVTMIWQCRRSCHQPVPLCPEYRDAYVVVKRFLCDQHHAVTEAFVREQQALLSMRRHPHILHLLDSCAQQTCCDLVLERMDGSLVNPDTHRVRVRHAELRRGIVAVIARTLADFHAAGYRHGDVKPDNILWRGHAAPYDDSKSATLYWRQCFRDWQPEPGGGAFVPQAVAQTIASVVGNPPSTDSVHSTDSADTTDTTDSIATMMETWQEAVRTDHTAALRVCDFAMASPLEERHLWGGMGTIDYNSPEATAWYQAWCGCDNACSVHRDVGLRIGCPKCRDNTRGLLADMPGPDRLDEWSLGIMAYELACGVTPFYSKSETETMKRIVTQTFTFPLEQVCPDLEERAFVQACLQPLPGHRPSIFELLQHPWLARPFVCDDA